MVSICRSGKTSATRSLLGFVFFVGQALNESAVGMGWKSGSLCPSGDLFLALAAVHGERDERQKQAEGALVFTGRKLLRRPKGVRGIPPRPMATKTQEKLRKDPLRRPQRQGPRPITGKEKPVELLEHAFGAYVGRQERTAFELMRRSLDEKAAIFLTLSGAMTPAGLHQSCLIPLVQSGASSRASPPPARTCTTTPTASSVTCRSRGEPERRRRLRSTGWRGSSGSTISASGKRRCSTPIGCSRR